MLCNSPRPSPAPVVVCQVAALFMCLASGSSWARSLDNQNEVSAVIPSPNQEFSDEFSLGQYGREADDLQRTNSISPTAARASFQMAKSNVEPQELASNEASVPVYASPFERAERGAAVAAMVGPQAASFTSQESSHAPPNYAPRPSSVSAVAAGPVDLKTSASYGHHQHGHYGHDHHGWLDMGAWTGGKGSFGWYADYPVGGKHHGYGRK